MKKFALKLTVILFILSCQVHTQTANIENVNSKIILRGEHEKDVEGAAFSSDGKSLAFSSGQL